MSYDNIDTQRIKIIHRFIDAAFSLNKIRRRGPSNLMHTSYTNVFINFLGLTPKEIDHVGREKSECGMRFICLKTLFSFDKKDKRGNF